MPLIVHLSFLYLSFFNLKLFIILLYCLFAVWVWTDCNFICALRLTCMAYLINKVNLIWDSVYVAWVILQLQYLKALSRFPGIMQSKCSGAKWRWSNICHYALKYKAINRLAAPERGGVDWTHLSDGKGLRDHICIYSGPWGTTWKHGWLHQSVKIYSACTAPS